MALGECCCTNDNLLSNILSSSCCFLLDVKTRWQCIVDHYREWSPVCIQRYLFFLPWMRYLAEDAADSGGPRHRSEALDSPSHRNGAAPAEELDGFDAIMREAEDWNNEPDAGGQSESWIWAKRPSPYSSFSLAAATSSRPLSAWIYTSR